MTTDLDALFDAIATSRAPAMFPSIPRPASPELIAAAEARLGVRLPASFRAFLGRFGRISFGSSELLGLYDQDFEQQRHGCIVHATERLRAIAGLPAPYVLVFNVGDGTRLVLDSSLMRHRECPILAWRSRTLAPEREHASYAAFLRERVAWEIEQERQEQLDPA